jgi:hypothetical protein
MDDSCKQYLCTFPLYNIQYEKGKYFHLMPHTLQVYEQFKQYGEYLQECKCRSNEKGFPHEHWHVLFQMNKKHGNYVKPSAIHMRLSRLGITVNNKRGYMLKEIKCESHLNGVIHYIGCSSGQATKKNKFNRHEHYDRMSHFVHERRQFNAQEPNNFSCVKLMRVDIRIKYDLRLHDNFYMSDCKCVIDRNKKRINLKMSNITLKAANQFVDNKVDHEKNLLVRRSMLQKIKLNGTYDKQNEEFLSEIINDDFALNSLFEIN